VSVCVHWQDESVQSTDTQNAEDSRYELACGRLASEAVRRLSADNVTLLVIAIRHLPND